MNGVKWFILNEIRSVNGWLREAGRRLRGGLGACRRTAVILLCRELIQWNTLK